MKESWLEIYKVPKETWIKEMEAALTALAPSRKLTMDSTLLVSQITMKCYPYVKTKKTLILFTVLVEPFYLAE